MRKYLLIFALIIPGLLGVLVFTAYAFLDYAALCTAYQHFERVAQSTHELTALYLAESRQNVYRLNLFAEGVWALLSAILAAIGLHGLCMREGQR